jgi:hypothetical protein
VYFGNNKQNGVMPREKRFLDSVKEQPGPGTYMGHINLAQRLRALKIKEVGSSFKS